MKEKILVSIDGSTKSLVTTILLKKQGFQLRGVIFDVSPPSETQDTSYQEKVQQLEKKIGIPIQLMDCREEAKALVGDEIEFDIKKRRRYDIKAIFQQRFLFPKLFALQKQHQFNKIATGHYVYMQYAELDKRMKVFQYHEPEQDEASLLVGLKQEELSFLEFPLGSIPNSMIKKLAVELEFINETALMKFDVPAELYYHEDDGAIGMSFVNEIFLENTSWFSGHDLGFSSLSCLMYKKGSLEPVGVKLLQYEGNGLKALLEQPLANEDKKIAAGDTVLFILDKEVLGGARIMQCL